ncbi:transcriptional regulator [Vibrio sp. HI00D65]|uniref:helix-turn-helix domain-containing protein n=1 Tax=Vibrio sp. HI00D65 TaxID=1822216 RepID=UPI0007B78E40|nr:helix-turn-helix domain-containing protein [Vibrio sp. HI00D65]KZX68605.1 transcriptional regulator [Vibrio sp. HI00D65]
MSDYQDLDRPIEYLKGREVTEKLKEITNSRDFLSLAEVLGVPKSTISTWHQRKLTPYEIIIRTHLRTGASVSYMATGVGEAFPDKNTQKHVSKRNEAKTLFDIDHFALVNGKLIGNETLAFDKSYLDKLGVLNVMGIEHDGTTFIVDKEVRQAVSGTYLVDMDGLLSLNEIQRLPGKKLAISFNGSTLTVEEDDVRVVGRVALIMEKC